MTRGLLCALFALSLHGQAPPEWTRPYPAHKIAGNIYYVGTEDLACFLVTDPAGHILINTGLASSAPQIRASVEKLGFRFGDIKILLTMQGHFDHVAAFAEVAKQTGAQIWATEPDAPGHRGRRQERSLLWARDLLRARQGQPPAARRRGGPAGG